MKVGNLVSTQLGILPAKECPDVLEKLGICTYFPRGRI
jgi:hypothetical protein